MRERYEPQEFEAKWRSRWQDADLFRTREEEGREKFYCLDFFPYPSGSGLSVGHCRNYIPGDVLARMKFMQGYNVLHPMGFDAFGLPAENEAIKRKVHPGPMVEKYAENYRRQLDLVGIGYDWSRSFSSCDPRFYKWTQWIFSRLFKRGLAYQKMAAVNWDPVDKTVLADEEVVGGRAERSGALVEKKWIPQWFFKITDYAQRLIDDLDEIDWPEGIKQQQRNWIGRSEGVQFSLKVDMGADRSARSYDLSSEAVDAERQLYFDVFTTRIDTIFGMSFCVLAPEHPLVDVFIRLSESDHSSEQAGGAGRAAALREYVSKAARLSDADRLATDRVKSGVFTGFYAINPANGKRVPIWVADYVLGTYGTGAVMAVPGHDSRDFEFAMKFGLEVLRVVSSGEGAEDPLPYEAMDGILTNSGEYSGMPVAEAQVKLGEWIEALGIGERKVQYKLRDWLISRQRYWGAPIPIIHTKDGDMEAVPDDCLPVLLPDVENYEPPGDGTSPLATIPDFVNVTDSEGRLGRRETDTMGGFACSSWYFLRFCDPHNDEAAWDPSKVAYWMPVDTYIGGAEHAVMHLLYARFWTKFLYDEGLVPVKEPFLRLKNQGQVLARTPYRWARRGEVLKVGEDGIQISFEEAAQMPQNEVSWRWARMSKSKGNVVTPDEVVAKEGADALRIYELFVAPFEADVQWSNEGLQGAVRFLGRVFRLVSEAHVHWEPTWKSHMGFTVIASSRCKDLRRLTHQTIKLVTEDIDGFRFNTYVSNLMKFVNGLVDWLRDLDNPTTEDQLVISEAIETLVLLLSPGAPHSADELWESLGKEGFTYLADWPIANEALAAAETVNIAIQINGKLRDTVLLPANVSEDLVLQAAKDSTKAQVHLEGKTIRKVIYVQNRLVNIVAN
jgi:leucyl-tRNA synthetase